MLDSIPIDSGIFFYVNEVRLLWKFRSEMCTSVITHKDLEFSYQCHPYFSAILSIYQSRLVGSSGNAVGTRGNLVGTHWELGGSPVGLDTERVRIMYGACTEYGRSMYGTCMEEVWRRYGSCLAVILLKSNKEYLCFKYR